MIEIKPIANRNVVINQINIPRSVQSVLQYSVMKTITEEIRSKYEISVNLHSVSENEIQRLNKEHRKKDQVTNVLSFPCDSLPRDLDGPRELGDIYFCIPKIKQEAADLKIDFIHHLVHLAVHSSLHLLGYNHDTDKDFGVMKNREIRILTSMKIPNPYETDQP